MSDPQTHSLSLYFLQRPVDRICAVHVAQLYLIVLQLPGSGAFKIFHPMIFQRMLDTFHLFHDEGGRILCNHYHMCMAAVSPIKLIL